MFAHFHTDALFLQYSISKRGSPQDFSFPTRSYSEPDFQAAIEDMKRRADASKEGSKIQKDGYYRLPGREAIAFAVQEQLLPCCLPSTVASSIWTFEVEMLVWD